MIHKGDFLRVRVTYPRNPELDGEYSGQVEAVGCYRSGFAYIRLEGVRKALPNSARYLTILDQHRRD